MPRREIVRPLAGGEPAPMKRCVLVAIGNTDNARALVDAGIRLTGAERPSELLIVRLIATAGAPEFRTGLRDEENQVDRSIEVREDLRHQADAIGVMGRANSFLSDDVRPDLVYIFYERAQWIRLAMDALDRLTTVRHGIGFADYINSVRLIRPDSTRLGRAHLAGLQAEMEAGNHEYWRLYPAILKSIAS
jgi:hypothetical protein